MLLRSEMIRAIAVILRFGGIQWFFLCLVVLGALGSGGFGSGFGAAT